MEKLAIVDKKYLVGRNAEERILLALRNIFEDSKHKGSIGYVLTDKELVFLINQRLPEEYHVDYYMFEKIKGNMRKIKSVPKDKQYIYRLLVNYFQEILIQQKLELHDKMMEAPAGAWQKYSWWLERKWDELNAKSKVEVTAQQEYKAKIEEASEDAERLAERYQNVEEANYEVEDEG